MANDAPSRIGRMPRWQRRTTWAVLGGCMLTGFVYLILIDFVPVSPAVVNVWWIAHGASSLVAFVVVGGAATSHVVATWRAGRGRFSGAIHGATLAILGATAVLLFYGPQGLRPAAAWLHSVIGVAALAIFPAHVWWGRTRQARRR